MSIPLVVVVDSISCLYTNCRSVVNKFAELANMISESGPNVVCLTETWLTHETEDSCFSLPSYHIFRKDRLGGRGGGVAILVHSDLICHNVDSSLH